MRQHGNKRIHAEQRNLSSDEITDPRLTHPEPLGRLLLCQLLILSILP
jgi:hypothetical protein